MEGLLRDTHAQLVQLQAQLQAAGASPPPAAVQQFQLKVAHMQHLEQSWAVLANVTERDFGKDAALGVHFFTDQCLESAPTSEVDMR